MRLLAASGLALGLSLAGLMARAASPALPTLDINLASQAELEQLPQLGPALSEQLLAARAQGGPFQDWSAVIRRLRGVGPAKAQAWSDAGLRVGNQAFSRQGSAAASGARGASPGTGDQPKN